MSATILINRGNLANLMLYFLNVIDIKITEAQIKQCV